MKIPITVLILTKNEERVLQRTLQSVRDFAQVIVVDSHSTDETCQIAELAGAEVVQFTWDGRYPKKKEWALTNAPIYYDWVLYLDADESVTEPLATELRRLMSDANVLQAGAYDIDLEYFFLGRWMRHGHQVTKRALVRRTVTTWPRPDDLGAKMMWEVEGHYQPQTAGPVARCKGRIRHEDLDPLYDYFARHNRYSDWEAHLRFANIGAEINSHRSRRGQIFARIPGKPIAFFFYSYFVRQGWREGRAGLHYALAQAFYYWQISIKLAELKKSAW